MRRRDFFTLLGGAAAAWPLAARAQQPPPRPVVGYLNSTSPNTYTKYTESFRRGLRSTGYADGENISIVYRWAEGQNDRLPGLAADLVHNQVDVIVATGATAAAVAAKAATGTIPIVFVTGGDPVEFKLVDSFNKPGGNLTGISFLANALSSKQLELMHEIVPHAKSFGVLVNPTNPTLANSFWEDAQTAARTRGVQVNLVHASREGDFTSVLTALAQKGTGALLIGADGFFTSRIELLAQLTMRNKLPSISSYREFSAAGGLISYGTSVTDAYHQVGVYTGKVLRGEKPSELPIMRPTKFEFVINLKSARELGLVVPVNLQVAADEIIE
jgi:putative tryptophan/tyrosine transport system substrate-binding protein